MPNLTWVSLNGNQITAAGICELLPVLFGARKLDALELADNPLGDEGVALLAQLTTFLSSMLLNNVGMTDKGLHALIQPESEYCNIPTASTIPGG